MPAIHPAPSFCQANQVRFAAERQMSDMPTSSRAVKPSADNPEKSSTYNLPRRTRSFDAASVGFLGSTESFSPLPMKLSRSSSFNKPSDGTTHASEISRRLEEGNHGTSAEGSILHKIRSIFDAVTRNQVIPDVPSKSHRPGSCKSSRVSSRRSSFTLGSSSTASVHGNLRRSLAINADVEDVDPFDNGDIWNDTVTLADVEVTNSSELPERRRKKKHKIVHCAQSLVAYQEFTLTLCKALLTFGSPSHRIELQLQCLAKVFEMEAQFLHLAGTIQVSFGDSALDTSETCLIKAVSSLALGRIQEVHDVYKAVLHDKMYATDGTKELRKLLAAPPRYGLKTTFLMSFLSCFLICGISFSGSLNDMWVAGIFGVVVHAIQLISAKSQLSASGSEIFAAAVVSFVARGLSSIHSGMWCFTAISSASIIALLPAYSILAGSLDIAGRNVTLGAPKIVSGIVTSLYLGFGLTLGSDIFLFVDRSSRKELRMLTMASNSDIMLSGVFQARNGTALDGFLRCNFMFDDPMGSTARHIVNGCYRDPSWGWYLQPLPRPTLFLLVPLFGLFTSIGKQQHWWSRQMFAMILFSSISFSATMVANMPWALRQHPDYVALVGSFIVGIFGNIYSRVFGGMAFTTMLTGILLLIPNGLAVAGDLTGTNSMSQDEYTQSLTLARKMLSVIIGVMAGVYASAAVVYWFGRRKRTALMTF